MWWDVWCWAETRGGQEVSEGDRYVGHPEALCVSGLVDNMAEDIDDLGECAREATLTDKSSKVAPTA